jgi:hypothetical protein
VADDAGVGRPWLRAAILTLLGLDGVLSAVVASFLLAERIGTVPFPISALISGIVNAALVWAASQWTSSPRLAATPLLTWLATVAGLTLGGPGGDIVFAGVGFLQYEPLILLVLGVLPPAAVLWHRSRVPG